MGKYKLAGDVDLEVDKGSQSMKITRTVGKCKEVLQYRHDQLDVEKFAEDGLPDTGNTFGYSHGKVPKEYADLAKGVKDYIDRLKKEEKEDKKLKELQDDFTIAEYMSIKTANNGTQNSDNTNL